MYTYRQIFKQAFKVTWQNPSLWFFGFFVALMGSAGEVELLGSYGVGGGVLFSFWQGLAEGGLFTAAGIRGIGKILVSQPFFLFLVALIFLLILGLSALVIWLVIVSQAALIGQIIGISRNETLGWRDGFNLGLVKFWPVLGLNVLLRLISFIFLALGAVFYFLNFPGSLLIFIIVFDICFVFIVLISFLIKYAICGVVLRDMPFVRALKSAWQIFIKNWLLSLEIAIILFVIYLITNSLLFWFINSILFIFLRFFSNFIFGLILVFLSLLAIFTFVQILLIIFHWASWAIVFELLTTPGTALVSRIKSGFKKIV